MSRPPSDKLEKRSNFAKCRYPQGDAQKENEEDKVKEKIRKLYHKRRYVLIFEGKRHAKRGRGQVERRFVSRMSKVSDINNDDLMHSSMRSFVH